MRGQDTKQSGMFSYLSPESRVPADHPLRAIKLIVDAILVEMSPQFKAMYSHEGRPSVPPEMLLRALLLQIFYTVRSERMLVEELQYNLLFRWFVGLSMDGEVWVATTFSKNRERLLKDAASAQFFAHVVAHAQIQGLMSDEHFTVDGTLIEAWASHKSFRPRAEVLPDENSGDDSNDERHGRNAEVDFRGEKRSNATHVSTTDPDCRLARKSSGHQAQLAYHGHLLMENRNGLVRDALLSVAGGTAERDAALTLLKRCRTRKRGTLGADKGYDVAGFVKELRALNVTPHVARKRHSAIDGRVTRHEGYAVSQKKRKRVEEIFGWMKTVGLMRKTRHIGLELVGDCFLLAAAAYNLVRIRNLTRQT